MERGFWGALTPGMEISSLKVTHGSSTYNLLTGPTDMTSLKIWEVQSYHVLEDRESEIFEKKKKKTHHL